jgi:hypothetical protein
MMIEAANIVSAFRNFLDNSEGVLSSDALNAHPLKGGSG